MKTTAQRKAERKRQRSERLYGPPGFADFVRGLPCLKCERGPSEPHHDPTAANGGTWRDVSPLCSDCHTQDPRSRHEHPGGYKAFWAEIGVTREEAAAETQRLWEESLDFLPVDDLP